MITLYIILGFVFLLAALIFIAKKWGGASEQKKELKKDIKAVEDSNRIKNEIENLSDDKLLDEWFSSVRNKQR